MQKVGQLRQEHFGDGNIKNTRLYGEMMEIEKSAQGTKKRFTKRDALNSTRQVGGINMPDLKGREPNFDKGVYYGPPKVHLQDILNRYVVAKDKTYAKRRYMIRRGDMKPVPYDILPTGEFY